MTSTLPATNGDHQVANANETPTANGTTAASAPSTTSASTASTVVTPLVGSVPTLPRVCSACGRGGAVNRCSRCLSSYYCSSACQAKDWKQHKVTCQKAVGSSAAAGANGHPRVMTIPPNSAAVSPPASSSASTRSSVASSTASAINSSKEVSTTVSSSSSQPQQHSHSHGGVSVGGGHGHSHGPQSSAHGHSHSHSCSNPNCPHHGAQNKANQAAAAAAAQQPSTTAAQVQPQAVRPTAASTSTSPSVNTTSSPSSSPPPTASSPTSASTTASSSSQPVHSQTSYSPVPVSNVSASSRHIYVPPCRPILRPNFLNYPQSFGPPLSCIHGFHTNLLFSQDSVRILYGDLVDPRHVLQSLCDLHAKMKVWKKKMKDTAGSGSTSTGGSENKKKKVSELPLPTPPSIASAKNPNIGIEFHLNDMNPHVLARSILFLVSAYMSSAVMNQGMALQTATNFGITIPPNTVHAFGAFEGSVNNTPMTNATNPLYTMATHSTITSDIPPPPVPCLSSYGHWSPSDHWSYLFGLYGCYQLPLQFIKRTRETLELLVRLTGQNTIEADRLQDEKDGVSITESARENFHFTILSPSDSHLFNQHPYTFFLNLPPLTLSVLYPIWKNWEDGCFQAIQSTNQMKATGGSTNQLSAYQFPPCTPLFSAIDVALSHPDEPNLQTLLNNYYTHGAVKFERKYFSHVVRTEEEWAAVLKEEEENQRAKMMAANEMKEETTPNATNAAATNSTTLPPSRRVDDVSIPELLPPSVEEYANISAFLYNPTLLPINFAKNSSFAPVVSNIYSSNSPDAESTTPAIPTVTNSSDSPLKPILDEVSLKWLYAHEPFSMLLPKLPASPAATAKEKDKKEKSTSGAAGGQSEDGGSTIPAIMELMSKMSHALFWVLGFQQSAALPQSGSTAVTTTTNSNSKANKIPYVRLYFYNHDLYFHLHTYDFLYDRILVYHLPEYTGLQSLVLLARHRMKNPDSFLECSMNFPSCWLKEGQAPSTPAGATGTEVSSQRGGMDVAKFCLLSLNANSKLIRNIFGWEIQSYTYPGGAAQTNLTNRALSVLRFTVCDYNLDLTAPAGHLSDGFRVMNDWFMTAIQPILLHKQFDDISPADYAVVKNTTPRSVCNLRTFCLLIGLLIKQGHLDQAVTRQHMVQLFATLLTPRGPYEMDHLFTSLITHIGLLKAELLPLMYLLLTPLEDTSPEVMHHNTLFFKGLWQLELVSMKFEALIPAFHQQQSQTQAGLEAITSASTPLVTGHVPLSKLLQQHKISHGNGPENDFETDCKLCQTAGVNHAHHSSHATTSGPTGGIQFPPKEPILSLLFVTDPRSCPVPVSAFAQGTATATATTGGASTIGSPPPSPSPVLTSSSTSVASSPSPAPIIPGQVPPDSPLAWVNQREGAMLRWLRESGRATQLLDVVDIDWSSGIVTAWMNRSYVNYVRKCSSFAQVCVVDFESLRVIAPPRSVVHLKTIRSMNIR